ncbi:amino acid synthesis family protein [Dongia sp.]|uniref:amino acid synthesis family protein n=1 Tax=Dongia sp. TaxID=1977262 RepID=UPI0035AEE9D0
MPIEIRKIVTYCEDTLVEGGKPGAAPIRLVAAAAILRNPWHERGFVENLRPEILAAAPILGNALVPIILDRCGGRDRVEGYGKAAVVGTAGEIEHASALIHTLRFGNVFREAVGGTSYLSFTNKRGGAGCAIAVPMMHKLDEGQRSHYLTIEFTVNDAPAPDEIVVALGASTGGRLHPRIGNRYIDMAEIEAEKKAG